MKPLSSTGSPAGCFTGQAGVRGPNAQRPSPHLPEISFFSGECRAPARRLHRGTRCIYLIQDMPATQVARKECVTTTSKIYLPASGYRRLPLGMPSPSSAPAPRNEVHLSNTGCARNPSSKKRMRSHCAEKAVPSGQKRLPTPIEWKRFNWAGAIHGISRNMRCFATLF